jgi:hypothetical protein
MEPASHTNTGNTADGTENQLSHLPYKNEQKLYTVELHTRIKSEIIISRLAAVLPATVTLEKPGISE